MEKARIAHLLQQHTTGSLSVPEHQELSAWLQDTGENDLVDVLGVMMEQESEVPMELPEAAMATWFSRMMEIDRLEAETATRAPRPVHFLKTAWFRYAAILLLIAGTGTYLWLTTTSNTPPRHPAPAGSLATTTNNIPPGGNKAILTLADGSTIVLDSAANGSLAQQQGANIIKLEAGKLAYQNSGAKGGTGTNTIRTPRGGQYQVVLQDGTKVWLNAASSITFPTAFVTDRKLTITGEVYLEVAKDKSTPFIITANQMDVQVLGTSFNIQAYGDESFTSTTLIEGSVRVGAGNEKILISPGEQAVLGSQGLIRQKADIEKVLAWKNGLFNFQDAGLQEVMAQLTRWYNIEVVYPKGIPHIEFYGKMSRNLSLADVLKALEESKVHFRVEGSRLIVLP